MSLRFLTQKLPPRKPKNQILVPKRKTPINAANSLASSVQKRVNLDIFINYSTKSLLLVSLGFLKYSTFDSEWFLNRFLRLLIWKNESSKILGIFTLTVLTKKYIRIFPSFVQKSCTRSGTVSSKYFLLLETCLQMYPQTRWLEYKVYKKSFCDIFSQLEFFLLISLVEVEAKTELGNDF